MQPLNKFNDNLGTAILLVGGAGSGKTVLGMRLFPRTYVLVADPNFKSGKDYVMRQNLSKNIVGFDMVNFDLELGKAIPPNQRYDRLLKCLSAAQSSPDVDCIFIDSASFIEDIFKVKITGVNVEVTQFKGKETYHLWGDLIVLWKSIILQLRQSGKKIIFSCHERKDKDEADGIFKYEIDLDGSIRNQFPKLMSDVWRCEIEEKLGTHSWNLRMLSNVRQEHLKRSSEFSHLKPTITQDELVKYLETQRNLVPKAA